MTEARRERPRVIHLYEMFKIGRKQVSGCQGLQWGWSRYGELVAANEYEVFLGRVMNMF